MTATANRRIVYVVGLLASIALAAGCGGSDLSTEDAHDTRERCRYLTHGDQQPGSGGVRSEDANAGACLDDRQKRSIAFPNHFANFATACDGYGHRIWVTTSEGWLVKPDPSCPGYTSETGRAFGAADVQTGDLQGG